jgi:hypothetical protein
MSGQQSAFSRVPAKRVMRSAFSSGKVKIVSLPELIAES